MVKSLPVLIIACGVGSLAFLVVACLQAGYSLALPLLGVLGLAWLAVPIPRLGWLSYVLFALAVLAAGVIALLGVPAWFTLPAVILGMAAWDLAGYSRQVQVGKQLSGELSLRRHLLALGLICLGGLLAAGLTTVVRLQVSLGVALAAALFVVVSLGLGFNWIRRAFDHEPSSDD